ncbi:MAG: YkgJ family cysteine cluster protein [Bradymonadaceae bacterium]
MKLPSSDFRFECIACGQCCRRTGFVFFTVEELDEAARHLDLEPHVVTERYGLAPDEEGFMAGVDPEAPCPFLVGDQCSIHPVKPEQCRTYPFWPELLIDTETWGAEREYCPGIGQGKLFSKKEVRTLMAGKGKTDPE